MALLIFWIVVIVVIVFCGAVVYMVSDEYKDL